MASIFKERFEIPKRYNTWALGLMGIGILAIIILFITTRNTTVSGEELQRLKMTAEEYNAHRNARFWASLLQNSVYFLLTVNAVMFFICATTLAWGGFQLSFRRVSEALATCIPVVGVIAFIIMMVLIWGPSHILYEWADPNTVKHDASIEHKSGFLNRGFFTIWTIITIGGWWLLERKIRQLSTGIDDQRLTVEEGKRYMWDNTVWTAIYIVLFALTVLSSIPWLWLMSLNAHWYSTMYSWYTFASTFVSGLALIIIFVVFLKNLGYLELTNKEHLHDLGKFLFAFSIFWTYLWFDQFMLIWYANIPEETVYFKLRMQGPYRSIFFLNLIINFLVPFLLLMTRGSKRNYGTITMIAVMLLFGHWLDFYQMVMPAVWPDHIPFMLLDLGVAAGFIGLIMFVTARSLAKYSLLARNHPLLKESIIHHT
jgi:hypothetical protein